MTTATLTAPAPALMATSVSAPPVATPPPAPALDIPDYLVREVVNGVKFYYPGFRDVLNHTKTSEDIMPDSVLQGVVKTQVGFHLNSKLSPKQYRIIVGESGLHIGRRNNFGLDIAVYNRSVLTQVTASYANVPAELVIEIDLDVEVEDRRKNLFDTYVLPKIQQLLDFGTQRVVWFFLHDQKTLVAQPGQKWQIQDLAEPVELMPGITLDLLQVLEEADVKLSDLL